MVCNHIPNPNFYGVLKIWHGLIITSHTNLMDMITYPCPSQVLVGNQTQKTDLRFHWIFNPPSLRIDPLWRPFHGQTSSRPLLGGCFRLTKIVRWKRWPMVANTKHTGDLDHGLVSQGTGEHLSYHSLWRHQMETFSALLAICAGNSPVFPSQRPVTRNFGVSVVCALNKRLTKQSWGWWFETPSRSLWRHCNVV